MDQPTQQSEGDQPAQPSEETEREKRDKAREEYNNKAIYALRTATHYNAQKIIHACHVPMGKKRCPYSGTAMDVVGHISTDHAKVFEVQCKLCNRQFATKLQGILHRKSCPNGKPSAKDLEYLEVHPDRYTDLHRLVNVYLKRATDEETKKYRDRTATRVSNAASGTPGYDDPVSNDQDDRSAAPSRLSSQSSRAPSQLPEATPPPSSYQAHSLQNQFSVPPPGFPQTQTNPRIPTYQQSYPVCHQNGGQSSSFTPGPSSVPPQSAFLPSYTQNGGDPRFGQYAASSQQSNERYPQSSSTFQKVPAPQPSSTGQNMDSRRSRSRGPSQQIDERSSFLTQFSSAPSAAEPSSTEQNMDSRRSRSRGPSQQIDERSSFLTQSSPAPSTTGSVPDPSSAVTSAPRQSEQPRRGRSPGPARDGENGATLSLRPTRPQEARGRSRSNVRYDFHSRTKSPLGRASEDDFKRVHESRDAFQVTPGANGTARVPPSQNRAAALLQPPETWQQSEKERKQKEEEEKKKKDEKRREKEETIARIMAGRNLSTSTFGTADPVPAPTSYQPPTSPRRNYQPSSERRSRSRSPPASDYRDSRNGSHSRRHFSDRRSDWRDNNNFQNIPGGSNRGRSYRRGQNRHSYNNYN